MGYTRKEQAVLSRYFTNTEDDVFALVNLPEVIKGTLISRYSRSGKDMRRLFLDEFIASKEVSRFISQKRLDDKKLDVARAENFYERILVGFGDDSVAELGGAHLALENISVLATKSIEEHRIGLSPLEKSTRYVYFDKKVDGEYLFYKDKDIMRSKYKKLYLETNRLLFDTYSRIVREIQPILKKIFPGDEKEEAYRFTIRAKACDTARALLPVSAKTNMGLFGNGRAFEYLLTHLLNDPLREVRELAQKMNRELRLVIPAFVKRVNNERGRQYGDYLNGTRQSLAYLKRLGKRKVALEKKPRVKLVDYDRRALEKVAAAIIYERTNLSYQEVLARVKRMSRKEKERILKSYCSHRQSRHHKPGRAFEWPYFSFEITADWGVYKDLMRHRMLTRHRQLFTNEMGYDVPYEVAVAGFEKIFRRAMEAALDAYDQIKKDFPYQAQYLVTHGAYNRFYLRMNLRELVHLTELRSIRQGHPSYRKVAQGMARIFTKKFPLLAKYALPFVDYNDYHLERLEAFRKLEKKAREKGVRAFVE